MNNRKKAVDAKPLLRSAPLKYPLSLWVVAFAPAVIFGFTIYYTQDSFPTPVSEAAAMQWASGITVFYAVGAAAWIWQKRDAIRAYHDGRAWRRKRLTKDRFGLWREVALLPYLFLVWAMAAISLERIQPLLGEPSYFIIERPIMAKIVGRIQRSSKPNNFYFLTYDLQPNAPIDPLDLVKWDDPAADTWQPSHGGCMQMRLRQGHLGAMAVLKLRVVQCSQPWPALTNVQSDELRTMPKHTTLIWAKTDGFRVDREKQRRLANVACETPEGQHFVCSQK